MSSISLTASVGSSLAALKTTARSLETTTDRLSTGKKVSSAIDNPTNYFAAQNYTARANSLSSRLDSMSEATEQINAADNGITTIKNYLSQMKGVVNNALSNTGSSERRSLGEQFNELIAQVRDMAKDSSYGGINLIYNNASTTVQFGENIGDSTLTLQGFNISAASGHLDANGELGSSGVAGSNGEAYALSIDIDGQDIVGIKSFGAHTSASAGSASAVLSTDITVNLDAMLVDAQTLMSGYSAYAHSDASANLNLTNDVYTRGNSQGSDSKYIFDPDGSSAPFQLTANGSYWTASYSGTWNTSVGNAVSDLVTTMDKLAVDWYLSNSVTTDVTDLSGAISTFQSVYTTLKGGSGGSTTSDAHEIDWGGTNYQTDLTDVIGQIEDVDSTLQTQSSKLANNLAIITQREDYTNNSIDILNNGADDLTLANLNEEGANLLSLQTSQSLAVQALALSSASASNVLSIIR
jgi:flagellin